MVSHIPFNISPVIDMLFFQVWCITCIYLASHRIGVYGTTELNGSRPAFSFTNIVVVATVPVRPSHTRAQRRLNYNLTRLVICFSPIYS